MIVTKDIKLWRILRKLEKIRVKKTLLQVQKHDIKSSHQKYSSGSKLIVSASLGCIANLGINNRKTIA